MFYLIFIHMIELKKDDSFSTLKIKESIKINQFIYFKISLIFLENSYFELFIMLNTQS